MKDPTQLMIEYHTASREEAQDYLLVLDAGPGVVGVHKFTLECLFRESAPYLVPPTLQALAEWAMESVDWDKVTASVSRHLEIPVESSFVTGEDTEDGGVYRVYIRSGRDAFLFLITRERDSKTADDLASVCARQIVGERIAGRMMPVATEIKGSMLEAW